MKKVAIALVALTVLFTACKSERDKMEENIANLEKNLIADSSAIAFSTKAQTELATAFLTYADKFPEDKKAQEYVYKAGSLYIGMKNGPKAIEVFQRYIKSYPEGANIGQAYFNIAFVYENQLHDKPKAIEAYKTYISKFPNHPLAKDAATTLGYLESGKTDLDIVHGFLQKTEGTQTEETKK